MNHKINITKSRAGHYTVTVRDFKGFRVYIQDKVATLQQARRLAFEYMDRVNAARDMPSDDDYLAALGPCGK